MNKKVPSIKHLQVEVTSKCNLRCKMCMRRHSRSNLNQDMDLDIFERLINSVPNLKTVGLFGWGDPFLNKNLFEMIHILKSKGIIVNITTNGLLMNKLIIQKIVESKVNGMCISLDSIKKNSYEYLRENSDFKKVIANIKLLNKMKKWIFPHVSIAFIGMKDNISELPSIIRFAKKNGVDNIFVTNLMCSHKSMEAQALYNPLNIKLAEKYFQKSSNLAKILGIPIRLPLLIFNHSLDCWQSPNEKCFITWSGKVRPCDYLCHDQPKYVIGRDESEDIRNFTFGDLKNQDLKDIWGSERYKIFRKKVSKKEWPKPCKLCLYRLGIV